MTNQRKLNITRFKSDYKIKKKKKVPYFRIYATALEK